MSSQFFKVNFEDFFAWRETFVMDLRMERRRRKVFFFFNCFIVWTTQKNLEKGILHALFVRIVDFMLGEEEGLKTS
jgi:hypothetical protein